MLNTLSKLSGKSDNAQEIAAVLSDADIVPLLMSLAQITGDESLVDQCAPYISGGWNYQESIPEPLRKTIIDRMAALLAEGGIALETAKLPRERLRRLIDAAAGTRVPDEFVPLIMEETRLDPEATRGMVWHRAPDAKVLSRFHVIIVGAGISGLLMAIRLKQAGIDYTIVEKNPTHGGTWYENTYPDCAVDTPSHFYCFSFAPNPDWSKHFVPQKEVWDYLDRVAREQGILDTIRFNTEAVSATFDESSATWSVKVRDAEGRTEELRGNLLISAVGQLTHPAIPPIPGLDSFPGAILHSGKWNNDVPLEGRRIVMVGTGASGIQIGPAIARIAGHLSIVQRSPHWVMNNPNYHKFISEGSKWALNNVPFYVNWTRLQLFWATGDIIHKNLRKDPSWPQRDISLNPENHKMRETLIAHIRAMVGHRPDLMEKVIPDFPPYGKRMLRDNYWFETLLRPNVDLYNDEIAEIRGNEVRLKGGAKIAADVLVFATGFQAARMIAEPDIANASGKTLRDVWGDEEPRAFLGVAVPEFPNLFILYGPNTNVGHGGSVIFQVECQVRYILQAMREMIENDVARVEVRREPFDKYNEDVDREHASLVWTHHRVRNWYQNKKGRIVTNSPWRLVDYWKLTKDFDASDYLLGRRFKEAEAQSASHQ